MKDSYSLGGEIHSKMYHAGTSWEYNLKNLYSTAPHSSLSYVVQKKPPEINRKTRRKLAREISSTLYVTKSQEDNGELVELRKHLSQLPGFSFLGAKAMEAYASINELDAKPVSVIIDSGLDITLISQKTLD